MLDRNTWLWYPLPNRHTVANHPRPQDFLSEQSFPSLSVSCSSAVTYNVISALPAGLFQKFDYFHRQTLDWYLVERGVQISWSTLEGVYVTAGNPAFCLFLYLTGLHFRGELQHGGDVSQQKIKCRPIRTQEIGGVLLLDALYVWTQVFGRKKPDLFTSYDFRLVWIQNYNKSRCILGDFVVWLKKIMEKLRSSRSQLFLCWVVVKIPENFSKAILRGAETSSITKHRLRHGNFFL